MYCTVLYCTVLYCTVLCHNYIILHYYVTPPVYTSYYTSIDTLRSQGDWSPFCNGQMSVTSQSSTTEYETLKQRFSSWHDPIPDTINRCPSPDVMVSYAYASPAPRPGIYIVFVHVYLYCTCMPCVLY